MAPANTKPAPAGPDLRALRSRYGELIGELQERLTDRDGPGCEREIARLRSEIASVLHRIGTGETL